MRRSVLAVPLLVLLSLVLLSPSVRAQQSWSNAVQNATAASTPFGASDYYGVVEGGATHQVTGSQLAPLASPAFTGTPTAPTPATSDNSTKLATTAWVNAQAYAPLASPAFTGTPTAPTQTCSDNSTKLATDAFVQCNIRTVLTAPLTLYVSPTGSDTSNSCTAQTSPCATIQHAYNTALANYDTRGNIVTIQLADGTYSGGLYMGSRLMGQTSAAQLIIQGDTSTPTNTIVNAAVTVPLDTVKAAFVADGDGAATIQYLEIESTANGIYAVRSGFVSYQSITFGTVAAYDIYTNQHGEAFASPGTADTISGGAEGYIISDTGSLGAICASGTCTITCQNNPAFSQAFASAFDDSVVFAPGITFTGCSGVTGVRYNVTTSATIGTFNAGANYFPGNSAGTSSTNGNYQ